MRVVIEIEGDDAGTCTWVLPEEAAAAIAALPDEDLRNRVLKRLQSLLMGHLSLLSVSIRIEDILNGLDLVEKCEIKLGESLVMMS